MLQAATLNRRVRIEQRAPGQDQTGQPSGDWVLFVTLWANVRLLSGIDAIKADAQVNRTRASIRIRYRTDITCAMRAVCDDMVFQIEDVLPNLATREYTDLVCRG